jgi:uncharacterized membrane protein
MTDEAANPSVRTAVDRNKHLPWTATLTWLSEGWRDLWTNPLPSLAYGLAIAVASLALVAGLVYLGWDYILFPMIAGFFVVGPALASGLYEKSRLLAAGEPVSLARLLFPGRGTTGHILFIGLVLTMLLLLWLRAAVLIYALFFGFRPFPGLEHIAPMLFTTPLGLTMLAVGTVVGGLFAALSFAISVLSVPMLLDRKVDAFTAMGLSISTVWQNLPVMIAWGVAVLALALIGVATGMVGFIVIFPLLGHASWHVYAAMRDQA